LRPLAVLTALIFGSSAAISFGLTSTAIVFFVLKGEQPQLVRELPVLVRSCLGFLTLTGISGGCLYATLKELRWKGLAQVIMWLSVVAVGWAYWPRG
jgi:ABC-type methionine transport system permease subunit